MNNKKMLIAAIALGCAAGAWAQGGSQANPVDHEMKTMDANGDGKVSPDEHAAGVARMFETIDADKDGKLTAAEMDAAHARVTGSKPAAGEMSAAEKIRVIDSDGDGALTLVEHQAGAKALFDRQDTNKDGFLSKHELAAGHAMKMRK